MTEDEKLLITSMPVGMNVLLRHVNDRTSYVWACCHKDGSKAIMPNDDESFMLVKDCWKLVAHRRDHQRAAVKDVRTFKYKQDTTIYRLRVEDEKCIVSWDTGPLTSEVSYTVPQAYDALFIAAAWEPISREGNLTTAPHKPEPLSTTRTATDLLKAASDAIGDRAASRDTNAERSMKSTVQAFNAMYNTELTEQQGWMFMVFLKAARAKGGEYREDDFIDGAAYFALAGECNDSSN